MIRTIHLHGKLQELTGMDSLQLDVDTPTQLIAGLRSQVPNFRQAMIEMPKAYFVFSNADRSEVSQLTPATVAFPLNSKAEEIHLIPEVEGAGVEIFAAWAVTALGATGAAATAVFAIAYVAASLAVGMVVGAVAQALAPSPDTGGGNERPEERPSFLFNGAVNVVEQGYPVPLVYGTHMTGSIVVSAGIDVAEMAYATTAEPDAPPANGGGTTQPAIPDRELYQWGA